MLKNHNMIKSTKKINNNNIAKLIKKLKNNRDKITLPILLMMFSYIFYVVNEGVKHWAKHTKYTIGKVVEFQGGWRTSPTAIVIYEVNNTTYKLRNKPYRDENVEIGQRFLVAYDSIDCGFGVTYFDKPFTDTTIKIPPNGWINPPF